MTAAAPPRETARPLVPGPSSSGESTRQVQLAALRQVLTDGGPQIVYQPQLSLSRLVVDGYEALARFPQSPIRGTEKWFARARDLGLGPMLEAAAVRRAVHPRRHRPAGSILAINLSPGVLHSPAVVAALPDDLTGIEIELTEHESAPGIGRLRRRLEELRARGAQIAIDDVGVAHSGLRRVVELAPDRIKIDRHLVQGVAGSPTKTALIRAVVDLAEQIGAGVCAEGVETVDDLEALAELDVGFAQGWMIGLPEAHFSAGDPVALAAGRDSLTRMLLGRARPVTAQVADVDELLTRLARVTDPKGLGELTENCVGLLDGDELQLRVLSRDGESVDPLHPGQRGSVRASEPILLVDVPITRRCLETRAVIPIQIGVDGDPAQWHGLRAQGFEAALLVPVSSRDRVIGLLECRRRTPTPWSRRQIRTARTMAAMLGPVLDLLRP